MKDKAERRKPVHPPQHDEEGAGTPLGEGSTWNVGRIMTRHPLAFPDSTTVLEVCEVMAETRVGQVIVVDKGWRPRARLELPPEPKGIFTERDLIRAFATHREKVLGMSVGEVMTSPVVTVSPEEDLAHTAELMMLMRIRRIPVVERGKTVGILTRGRVMEAQSARLQEMQKENKELEERVVHDALTGLANRVLFEEVLEREITRTKTRGGQVSMLMLDIDFFKKVNDTYGHPVGDIVLRQFAQVLRQSLRRADLPARLGGEEFGVILVQAENEAAEVAEKVRAAVAIEPFGESGDPFRVTVSIGCATWSEKKMKSPAELVKAADEALYEAKGSGRNKVVVKR